MKFAKAIWYCAALILAALLFDAGILCYQGKQKALEFLTGYIVEFSLSIDNLVVFFLIFTHFKVDSVQQNKILSWGVLGAQLMRALFILGGVALFKHLSWIAYAFGSLLIFSGIKIFIKQDRTLDLEDNILLCSFLKVIPKEISPFFIVLIAVELADLMFAIDSIPAVLAITKDPFIVYSSNIFAILGLRAMYFVFIPIVNKIQYLHYILGIILVFIGFKMLTDRIWHMPIGYALGFIAIVFAIFAGTAFFLDRDKTEDVR